MTTITAKLERREDGIFVWRGGFETRLLPKAAGFRWSPEQRVWWTDKPETAAKLAEYADETTAPALNVGVPTLQASLDASRADDAAIDIPRRCEDDYLPYQRAGIAYAEEHDAVLFGDEMGLGKTIQGLGTINLHEKKHDLTAKTLVICPASLRLNWVKEAKKWLVRDRSYHIIDGSKGALVGADFIVVNFDVIWKKPVFDFLMSLHFDFLIVDEAHFCKDPNAKRSQALYGVPEKKARGRKPAQPAQEGLRHRADKILAMTGTPIPNRPVEGFPLFSALAPSTFKSFWGYAQRYCGAHHNGWGWDFRGASNLDELQLKLRGSFMVRRLKVDVLTELPPKRRQVIELPPDGYEDVIEAETRLWDSCRHAVDEAERELDIADAMDDRARYEAAMMKLREAHKVAFTEMSEVRHETAVAKLPGVVEHLRDLMESVDKVVVFAHHRDVIKAICDGMAEYGVVSITGDTSMADRQEAVDSFQTNSGVRVFVGNMRAAGIGITLTAASVVVFAELDWVPSTVSQAEDRCHRIGQRDSVLVQHLVFDNSLDARMARAIIEKQRVADAALDNDVKLVSESVEREEKPRKQPVVSKYGDAVKAAALLAVRCLSGMDADRASTRNDVGWNGRDTNFGHALAQCSSLTDKQTMYAIKMLRTYSKTQLPHLCPEVIGVLWPNKEDDQ